MSKELNLGEMNGHAIGRLLKEAMRRSMVAIRLERASFVAEAKADQEGGMRDVLTSADLRAQEIYLRTFRECFPGYGVVGEENSLLIPATATHGAYLTVDPLDGTKAFVRRQSHGVGTMVALVHDGKVISAYVGDVNANEVYGFRPGSDKVHRITDLDDFEELGYIKGLDRTSRYAQLREPEKSYSSLARKFLDNHTDKHTVDGGSIGVWMARLWKCESVAALLLPGKQTPWDSAPVIGISQKLGYVFLRPSPDGTRWEIYTPKLSQQEYVQEHETLVVHGSEVSKIMRA